jgi:hypothetical protein
MEILGKILASLIGDSELDFGEFEAPQGFIGGSDDLALEACAS